MLESVFLHFFVSARYFGRRGFCADSDFVQTLRQIAIHSIGDEVMDDILDVYEKDLEEHPGEDHRQEVKDIFVREKILLTI